MSVASRTRSLLNRPPPGLNIYASLSYGRMRDHATIGEHGHRIDELG